MSTQTIISPGTSSVDPARQTQLARAREQYVYDYQLIEPLAMAARVPVGEGASLEWVALVTRAALRLAWNNLHQNEVHRGRLSDILQALEAGKHQDLPGILRELQDMLNDARPPIRAKSLEDYAGLFSTLPLPEVAKLFLEDSEFARMRVAGPNPVWIRRVERLDERLPLTPEQYASVMDGDDLEVAGSEGRLYLADYAALDGAVGGVYRDLQKYVYAPLALFAVPPKGVEDRSLRPVAIQCGQNPGPDTPIFLPDGSAAWMMAKTIVQIADGNVHETVSHLAHTHLVMEPFVLATHRQLAKQHPIHVLLVPHFEGTLSINNGAQRDLIAQDGAVDHAAAGTIDQSRLLAVKGVLSWRANDAFVPKALRERGVDDATALPVYPYRDDALALWGAIHEWVTSYVSVYYDGDQAVQDDAELQAWIGELLSPSGGRMQGVGEDGAIKTRDYLCDLLCLIVFTCSAQHAAVNFPQNDIMSFAPAMPLAGYAPAPTSVDAAGSLLDMLPPLDQAQLQLDVGFILGSIHYTRLGQYNSGHFVDPRVAESLQAFQKQLADLDAKIGARTGPLAYKYLQPSQVPQSINI